MKYRFHTRETNKYRIFLTNQSKANLYSIRGLKHKISYLRTTLEPSNIHFES